MAQVHLAVHSKSSLFVEWLKVMANGTEVAELRDELSRRVSERVGAGFQWKGWKG